MFLNFSGLQYGKFWMYEIEVFETSAKSVDSHVSIRLKTKKRIFVLNSKNVFNLNKKHNTDQQLQE